MALVHVIDIATGEVVAAYPVPPTTNIPVQEGQEVLFVDIPYGDPNAPQVTIEVIGDRDVLVTTEDGPVLIEGLFALLEGGDEVRLMFSDTGQAYGSGPDALTVPAFASLDAFTATAAGGTDDGTGGGQTGTGGRGNDGSINPLDLNLDHIRAVGIDGVIPRPEFDLPVDIETDFLGEEPEPIVLTPSTNMVWESALNGGGGGGDCTTAAVFFNGEFVDVGGSSSDEGSTILATLQAIGLTATTFSGLTAADFTAALAGVDMLVLPEFENGNLGPALSGDAIAVIQAFVQAGGTLMIMGDSDSGDIDFLNTVFGFSLADGGSVGNTFLTADATGTPFADDPAEIESANATRSIVTGSLPSGSLSLYEDAGGTETSVAQIPFGDGQIFFMGWDWFDAQPIGSNDGSVAPDGGWLTVLDSVIASCNDGGVVTVPGIGENGGTLINGLGGPVGFGENTFAENDDGSIFVDVTPIFGPAGMNLFGTFYTGFWINNNGNITFDSALSTFTPFAITGATANPIIAPFFADVETDGGQHANAPTPGGNSTGSNFVYWDINTADGIITITWDDVGYYSENVDLLNAFQLVIYQVGTSGDFAFEFRYENIDWTTGDASGGSGGLGGTVAVAGWSAGDGANFFQLPQSSNQAAMLDLESTSNDGTVQDGNWVFLAQDGSVGGVGGGGGSGDAGTDPTSTGEFAFGTLDTAGGVITGVTHPDGITSVDGDYFVVEGTFPGGEGIDWILRVHQSTGEYEFELIDNTLEHTGINLVGADDQVFLQFGYSVQVGEQSASSTLTIGVKDDGPLISLKDGDGEGAPMVFEEDLPFGKPPVLVTDELLDILVGDFPMATQGINFNFGADGAAIEGMGFAISLKSVTDGDDTDGEGGGALPLELLTSADNLPVNTFYDAANKTLIGFTGGDPMNEENWVFTVELVDFMDGPQGNNMVNAKFTLYQAIEHPDINETGADDPIDLLFTVTVTDGDGDSASADVLFVVKDDGPNVVVNGEAPLDMLVLDETRPEGTETDGDSDPAGLMSTTADFSDNFLNIVDFGADGPGSFAYSLALNGSNVGSGLYALDNADTVNGGDGDGIGQGNEIVLNQVGNVITGSEGGTDYFTIEINPDTGVVTFTQLNNIWHANTGNDDDSEALTTDLASDLQVVLSVTDSDGDSDSAAINLGGGDVFKIEDDGPDAVVDDGEGVVLDMLVLDETRPEGTETDGNSNPAGLASTTANFADNFVAPIDYGTDGPGDVVYSLLLSGANVGSGLYALDNADTVNGGDGDGIGQGNEIVLNQVGNVITGSEGGTDYFTIEIDPNTGVATFTQLNNIWHANTGNDDDSQALTTEVPSDLQVVQTVIDADGDSDSAAIDLGGGDVFKIEDDGPNAAVADGEGVVLDMLVLDETRPEGTETDGDSDPAGLASTTANFADNFVAPANFGTDGPGDIVYSLMLSGANIGSGLYALDPADTSGGDGDGIGQGAEIVLNQVGDVITGSAGVTDYFTISIDPDTGVVTFTQLENIWHGDTGNDDDSQALTTDLASDLQVVQTVIDADGDSDSAAINLGGGDVFKIEDDGPDAAVNGQATLDMLVLDESPVGQETDGNSNPVGIATVMANFADNFVAPIDYGTDGAGDVIYSLLLSGANVGSGLYALDPTDTLGVGDDGDGIGQGNEIVLNQVGNVITGSEGGTDYFTIEIDPNTGVATFTQLNNIWHANTGNDDDSQALTTEVPSDLQVVQTVIDADGDSDSAAIDLGGGDVFKIEDDGPDAQLADVQLDMLVLDESPIGEETDGNSSPVGIATVMSSFADNFVVPVDFGTDGPGDVDYALVLNGSNVGSGLYVLDPNDTSDTDGDGIGQGNEIVLNQVGDVVTGSFGGTDYFTISINPDTGAVTFTQLNNVWHANTGDDDDTATITTASGSDLQIVQTVSDADGDSDSAALNIGRNVFKIEDDGPTAVSEEDVAEPGTAGTTNFIIVFDRSGSMDDNPGVDGFSQRIDLARAAVASLLEAAANGGTINVLIVDFASDAQTSGWLNSADVDVLEAANAYLNSLLPGGWTNYLAATGLVQSEFFNGTPTADENVVYFLSDGEPTTRVTNGTQGGGVVVGNDNSQYGLTNAEVAALEAFYQANNIETAYAVGVGNGTDTAELEEIAFPNDDVNPMDGTEDTVIEVTDESLLIETLLSTLNVVATGNVLTGVDIPGGDANATDGNADDFGTDGPGRIVSFAHDTVIYFADGTTAGGPPTTSSFVSLIAGVLILNTIEGGQIEFNFNTGSYDYEANLTNGGGVENFIYTIADADGDTDSATLSIALPETSDVTGLPLLVDATPNNADTINGGDDAEILGGDGGSDVLNGGGGNDLIYGGSGSDTIDGGAGNDFIFGGTGSDDILSSLGNDVINVGPDSSDDTVFYSDVLHAGDVIQNFDGNSAGGNDTIDLDGLFDLLAVATADRAGKVQITDNGSQELVHIDADGNAADFEVLLVTVNLSDGDLDIGTDIILGTL